MNELNELGELEEEEEEVAPVHVAPTKGKVAAPQPSYTLPAVPSSTIQVRTEPYISHALSHCFIIYTCISTALPAYHPPNLTLHHISHHILYYHRWVAKPLPRRPMRSRRRTGP